MTGDKDASLTHFWGQALTLRFPMSDQFSGCAAGKCVLFRVSQSTSHDGLISFYNSGGFTAVLHKQCYPFTQGQSWMPSERRCAHCKAQIAKQQITPVLHRDGQTIWVWKLRFCFYTTKWCGSCLFQWEQNQRHRNNSAVSRVQVFLFTPPSIPTQFTALLT